MSTYAENRAWRILLISFVAFLLLCGLTIYIIQWYLFQSSVALAVSLTTARGTVQVEPENALAPIAVTDRQEDIGPGTIIETDSNSQSTLTFVDTSTDQPVASVVLYRDSQIVIEAANSPRFDFTQGKSTIHLRDFSGRCEVFVLSNDSAVADILLETNAGAVVVQDEGDYIINASETEVTVNTRSGEAKLRSLNGALREVRAGQRGALSLEAGFLVSDADRSLLVNGDFNDTYAGTWEFYNDAETNPPGGARNVFFEGRPALMIDRSQVNWPNLPLGHGETGLTQELDVDIRGYEYLELRATFFIDEQSLSTCGELGSECPLMVRVDYTDQAGLERTFITGFFANHNPSLGYPVACDTCRTDHERLNLQSWYTFESGNLMERLPEELRPVELNKLHIYASGHAYKVYIASVELLTFE